MANKPKRTKTRHQGVYQEKDQWWIQATQRDHTGRRVKRGKYLPLTTPLTQVVLARSQMVVELEQELADRRQARPQPAPVTKTTLADFAEQWLGQRVKRIKPSTTKRYVAVLGERLLPVLGEYNIASLTRADVDAWVAYLENQRQPSGEPYARDTLLGWWRAGGTLLRDAAAVAGIADPTLRVMAPRSQRRGVREKVTLTAGQLGDLLQTVKAVHPSWYAEVFVLAYTGMRPGELYALEWSDVDKPAGVIHVRRSVWHGQVSTTKTDDPRDVGLTEPIRAVLAEHRTQMLQEQHRGLESGLVFPSERGGYRLGQSLLKPLTESAAMAGIETRVTPQVLRRTFNTLLLEAGVNAEVLRSQMGHASARMTSRYAGIHAEAKQTAVERLHRAVEPTQELGKDAGNTGW